MNINEPTPDQIAAIKNKYPDRSLHQVEAVDGDDVYFFLMTGPDKAEYKKYIDEVCDAQGAKTEKDRIEGIRKAIETAVMAMVRHPEREEVKAVFNSHPAMVQNLSDEYSKAAGSNIEVRSKKL